MQPKNSNLRSRPPESALRFLYEDEHLSTRAIGAIYDVSRRTVARWLIQSTINLRPPLPGLAATQAETPTDEDLRRMIFREHMSYEQIGAFYNIGKTAIAHWLDKYGIPRSSIWETRRKGVEPTLPTEDEIRELYQLRGLSTVEIGEAFGVSATVITRLCREFGISLRPSGFNGRRYSCDDGHEVRSTYEQRVDNWLFVNGISHEYEPRLPFDLRCCGDFFANDHYIEIWGASKHDLRYEARRERKTRLYQSNGLRLIELSPHDFSVKSVDRWKRKLATALTPRHDQPPQQSRQPG